MGVREPDDFEEAFAAMKREMPDGILMVSDALTTLNRQRVYDFAAKHHVPAIYEFDFLVRDGGLMAYGPDQDESFERVAALVDRILKGAKPAACPLSCRRASACDQSENRKGARPHGSGLAPRPCRRGD